MASKRNVAAGAALAVALAWAALIAQGGLSRYGLNDVQSRDIVMSAVEGAFSLGAVAKAFLALGPAARAGAVNDAVNWGKAYLGSAAFQQAWARERENARPAAPVVKGTIDEETKQEIADQLQQAAEMRKALVTLPADQRPQMEALIKELEDKAKDSVATRRAVTSRRAEDQERYQADLKSWEEERPADPKTLIAGRLHGFLTTCAEVDFDAKLDVRDGRKVFADEQYEQKSNVWKMCFRAGRESTAAARAAATAWLKEMGK
jgi:hypothetical protein